jgi:multidrug efflux pump subunit AcrB
MDDDQIRFQRPHYLIDTFTRHPLAANLLMIMLILAGIWGARQLNVQLNPRQDLASAVVEIQWPGAAAEDIERLLTQPLEYQLRSLSGLKNLTSRTLDGQTVINLGFSKDVDMGEAIDRIKQSVAQTRGLPTDIEPPVIRMDEYRETVAAILLSGQGSLAELVPLAREIERDLMSRGADEVEFRGIPQEEIAIQVDSKTLFELGVPLSSIAAKVLSVSSDVPAGSVGDGQMERKLRSLDQRRSGDGFAQMPITSSNGENLVRLGDIALIERRQQDNQRLMYHQGDAAIMIRLRRAAGSDTVGEADILRSWYEDNQEQLTQRGVQATIFLEAWRFAVDTLSLVFMNGLTGLCLVIATLFLFLNGRVASWVTAGIPISFLGALAVFHFFGGTINFISMIGMVMALGIVVDDAIVVGEHALFQFEQGKSPAEAAAMGAQRMFAPVMASSLTTMAAFLPLVILDEAFITEIPLLMLCVIVASLIECFLIMPGHLRHSFENMRSRRPGRFRRRFDEAFARFRDHRFLPLLHVALDNRRAVFALAMCAFAVALTLLASGRIKPEMDLNVDFEFADAYVQFAAGTTAQQREAYLRQLEQAAEATNQQFGGEVVVTQVRNINWARLERQDKTGSQYAGLWVELVSPDTRDITLAEFIRAWSARMPPTPLVETLQFDDGESNWPDIQLYFSGGDMQTLKAAAEELKLKLATYPGVSNVFDDLPYGKEQWVFSLTTEGRAAGLSSAGIGRQLRAAFEGYRVQLFTENDAELEVRVSLPVAERNQLATIRRLPIITPDGEVLPLQTVANIDSRRGIDRINHRNALKSVNVYGDVDTRVNTSMAVIEDLEQVVIPDIAGRYGVKYGLGDGSAGDARILGDLLFGALIALVLIYLILAWVFASWSWPLAVMVAIPLGLTGALAGLLILDLNLGIMAILGLFTLTGVIVNDSIILISAYKEYRSAGAGANAALEAACADRLRPVILTSVTTTLGLAPLMLESSPMGDAMSPLAVVICFGLLYGTTLILFVIPAILSALETITDRYRRAGTRAANSASPVTPAITGTGI